MNNTLINSRCICGEGLPWIKTEVIMIEPCEHLIHLKCLKNAQSCPYCNKQITHIVKALDYKNYPKLHQKCIDIISMTNYDHLSKKNHKHMIENLPLLLSSIAQLPFTKGIKAGKNLLVDFFKLNNIEIHVNGLNKVKKNEPKVFIAPHTSHFDFMAIFYVFETGFLSSAAINHNPLSKMLTGVIPLLIVDRTKKENTVDKMKEYVKSTGSICLFPEGMLTHPNTLIRFRTGAFHVGYPIYPLLIHYDNIVADMSIADFIFKLASKQTIRIDITVMNPYYPPFDDDKIEKIRCAMADKGGYAISRVSNRDIKEQNKVN